MRLSLESAALEIEHLSDQLRLAAPILAQYGTPFKDLTEPLGMWKIIDQGGNNQFGHTDGIGNCPCQSEWTCATAQTPVAAWPVPGMAAACAANPPAAQAASIPCATSCVQVMTHIWHGWDVVQNTKTGAIVFNCHTYAQYHCKLPNDPDRNRPPRHTDPSDPTPEL